MQSLFQNAPARRRYLPRMHRLLHTPRRAQRARDPQISEHALLLPKLPPGLSGLRLVQLSDIHHGLYVPLAEVARCVELANALRPDLIVVTGDFVTQSAQFIPPVAAMVGRLRAPLGIFAVLGNHDFRAGAETLTTALRAQRIHVLRNAHEYIDTPRGRIKIVGIDDSRQRPDLSQAMGAAEPGQFTLLLAHNPVALEEAAAAGVDFVLSGHTHGGQIKFQFADAFYSRFAPAGFQSSGKTRMYVSRGTGRVIVPLRIGAPPELAVFTLYAGG